jgi:hypothetical protein
LFLAHAGLLSAVADYQSHCSTMGIRHSGTHNQERMSRETRYMCVFAWPLLPPPGPPLPPVAPYIPPTSPPDFSFLLSVFQLFPLRPVVRGPIVRNSPPSHFSFSAFQRFPLSVLPPTLSPFNFFHFSASSSAFSSWAAYVYSPVLKCWMELN